jgi:hypothetical protein
MSILDSILGVKSQLIVGAICLTIGSGAGYYVATGQCERNTAQQTPKAVAAQHKVDVKQHEEAHTVSVKVADRKKSDDAILNQIIDQLRASYHAPETPACMISAEQIEIINRAGQ